MRFLTYFAIRKTTSESEMNIPPYEKEYINVLSFINKSYAPKYEGSGHMNPKPGM